MGHIRTKMYSNGVTAITAATSSDPPYDFSAAKTGSVVVKATNFGNADNTLVVDVYWGARERGLLSNAANITWVKDTGLTTTLTSTATPANPVVGVIRVTGMKSPLMKLVMTPAGTSQAARVVAYFEQDT